jgi:hypothetical protein
MSRQCYTTAGEAVRKPENIVPTAHPLLLSYVAAKKSREVASKAKSRSKNLKRSSAVRQCYTTFLVKQGGERDE